MRGWNGTRDAANVLPRRAKDGASRAEDAEPYPAPSVVDYNRRPLASCLDHRIAEQEACSLLIMRCENDGRAAGAEKEKAMVRADLIIRPRPVLHRSLQVQRFVSIKDVGQRDPLP